MACRGSRVAPDGGPLVLVPWRVPSESGTLNTTDVIIDGISTAVTTANNSAMLFNVVAELSRP